MRSSRRIERRCVADVAARVICANQRPDHTTIARFRRRHETALADLFSEVLALCAEAGLVHVGLVAIDDTKMHANASQHATRNYEDIAREILAEADGVDAAEDEQFGERRGDELPPDLATAQGRRGWLREAKRRLDEKRAKQARPIPRSRPDRLREAKRRLEEEHEVECRANADYEAYRARGRMKDGRRFGGPPNPYRPSETPAGKINVTDPDSRNVKTARGWVQGYNAQAVCTEQQIVIAAEETCRRCSLRLYPTCRTALRRSRGNVTDALLNRANSDDAQVMNASGVLPFVSVSPRSLASAVISVAPSRRSTSRSTVCASLRKVTRGEADSEARPNAVVVVPSDRLAGTARDTRSERAGGESRNGIGYWDAAIASSPVVQRDR
jgi:hypothetical protein